MNNKIKLSILICSLSGRLDKLHGLVTGLEQQIQNLNTQQSIPTSQYAIPAIEVLWLGDNKSISVGEKRNKLLSLSKGEYVCFIDDDDTVSPDYVAEIMNAIQSKSPALLSLSTSPDVVCFNVQMYQNGNEVLVHFSKDYAFNLNSPPHTVNPVTPSHSASSNNQNIKSSNPLPHSPVHTHSCTPSYTHIRMPNHLMPVKREHALRAGFPNANFGEDTLYGERLRGKNVQSLLKKEVKIDKVLYYYKFDPGTSETHQYNPVNSAHLLSHSSSPMVVMDVVIVSDATKSGGNKTDLERFGMTQKAVNTVRSPGTNVIVIEKSSFATYSSADTFRQSSTPKAKGKKGFNYNSCLNFGASFGNAGYICFSNNDVEFPPDFADMVVRAMKEQSLDVVSVADQHGHWHPDIISGFCFVMRRDAWVKIGKLKEKYRFWCADNVVTEQIKEQGLKWGKLPIKVNHLVSRTLATLPDGMKEKFTTSCVQQFNRDYNQNVLNMGMGEVKNEK